MSLMSLKGSVIIDKMLNRTNCVIWDWSSTPKTNFFCPSLQKKFEDESEAKVEARKAMAFYSLVSSYLYSTNTRGVSLHVSDSNLMVYYALKTPPSVFAKVHPRKFNGTKFC